MIEASELRDLNIARVSITGDCDGQRAMAAPASFGHERVTSAVWKGNIAEDHVHWGFAIEQTQSFFQRMGAGDNAAPASEQATHDFPRILVIFYH